MLPKLLPSGATQLLLAREFKRPDGVILEKLPTGNAAELVQEQPSGVVGGDSEDFVTASLSLEERVSKSLRSVSLRPEMSPYLREVDVTVQLLEKLFEIGVLTERSTWPRPQLHGKVKGYYDMHRAPAGLFRRDGRPSKEAVYEACDVFYRNHPELMPSRRGGRPPRAR